MQSVTAVPYVVVLSALLGSSSSVWAGENFVLLVDPATGSVAMRSDFISTVWIDQYSITSAGSLRPAFWNSLQDQLAAPGTWVQTANTTTALSESTTSGETSFQNGTGFHLGACFSFIFAQDLVFQYRLAGSTTPSLGVVSYGFFTGPPNPVQVAMPCHGDIDGDNAVNIDDLLAVISAWGPCLAPPAACPANIATGAGSESSVNIDDLLAVISAWGPCP